MKHKSDRKQDDINKACFTGDFCLDRKLFLDLIYNLSDEESEDKDKDNVSKDGLITGTIKDYYRRQTHASI